MRMIDTGPNNEAVQLGAGVHVILTVDEARKCVEIADAGAGYWSNAEDATNKRLVTTLIDAEKYKCEAFRDGLKKLVAP